MSLTYWALFSFFCSWFGSSAILLFWLWRDEAADAVDYAICIFILPLLLSYMLAWPVRALLMAAKWKLS